MPNRVPNQRSVEVKKMSVNKQTKYIINALEAVDNAASYLQSKGGFKLYMYIAKNQNNYKFNLSSSNFCEWSGLSIKAYNTAFTELVEYGFLVEKEHNNYVFYDNPNQIDKGVSITIPPEAVEQRKKFDERFVF